MSFVVIFQIACILTTFSMEKQPQCAVVGPKSVFNFFGNPFTQTKIPPTSTISVREQILESAENNENLETNTIENSSNESTEKKDKTTESGIKFSGEDSISRPYDNDGENQCHRAVLDSSTFTRIKSFQNAFTMIRAQLTEVLLETIMGSIQKCYNKLDGVYDLEIENDAIKAVNILKQNTIPYNPDQNLYGPVARPVHNAVQDFLMGSFQGFDNSTTSPSLSQFLPRVMFPNFQVNKGSESHNDNSYKSLLKTVAKFILKLYLPF